MRASKKQLSIVFATEDNPKQGAVQAEVPVGDGARLCDGCVT